MNRRDSLLEWVRRFSFLTVQPKGTKSRVGGWHQPIDAKPDFVKGLTLSRMFYEEAVRLVLESDFPRLKYPAALMGHGSEVLGFDSERSTDHHWGPRLQLFLAEQDYARYQARIKKRLSEKLPRRFLGYPVNFGKPDRFGVRLLEDRGRGPLAHRVEISTLRSFFQAALGVDPYRVLKPADWLSFPQQELLCLTAGEVFHNGLGELNRIRRKLGYYPKDVWLYLISCQWTKVAREEEFVGRCGEAGDELGSQIVAARLVRELVRLCFLLDKKYAPYSKWLGTAFAGLGCSRKMSRVLKKALLAVTWKQREACLSQAYGMVARMQNELKIGKPLSTKVSNYYHRPYRVLHAGRFAEQAREAIRDKAVRDIRTPVGSVDQFLDSTEALSSPEILTKLRVWSDARQLLLKSPGDFLNDDSPVAY